MIGHLAALHVGFKQIERAAEDLGEEVARKERETRRRGFDKAEHQVIIVMERYG